MLDIFALNTAIYSKIQADNSLALLHSDEYQEKVGYDYIPEGTAKPYCRFSIVSDTTNGTYQHTLLDTVQYQFSIFAENQSEASTLQKALGTSFNAATLTLSSGKAISARIMSGSKMLVDRSDPKTLVYHAIAMIEFRVQS